MIVPACLSVALALAVADDPDRVRFREQVAPILVSRCLGCHRDGDAQGGLNLSTFAGLRRGGAIEGDLILVPGEPDESHLVAVLGPEAPIRMPLDQDPLSDAQIGLIARWIAEGAAFDGPSEDLPLASLVDPLANLPRVTPSAEVADPVAAVAFAPDGSALAAARGAEVFVFEPSCTDPVERLDGHDGPIHALAFSPDGRRLIASGGRAGLFGSVTVWDLDRADPPRSWRGHADAVYAVAFAPDGRRIASASGDRTVKIWDAETGRRIASLGDATEELYAVAFGPGGASLLAGGADRTIRRWALSADSATLDRSAIAHDGAVLDLLVAPDGASLVSTGEDRALKRWSLPDLAPMAAWPPQPDWPLAAALSPSGDRIALGRYDGALVLLPADSQADPSAALTLLDAPDPDPAEAEAEAPPTPGLIRRPSLGPPSPKGAARGRTVTVHLAGHGVGLANAVVFDDPGLVAAILPSETPDPNRLQVALTIPPDARIGRHAFRVQTPFGVPAPQPFAVYDAPERAEAEPNDRPDQAPELPWPTTLAGAIDAPGDVDHARFAVRAGRTLVVLDRGGALGSALDPELELRDEAGRPVARGRSALAHRAEADGTLTLRIADRQFGGSGNHFYRVEVGPFPRLDDAFPLGVQLGRSAEVAVSGPNLGASVVAVSAPESVAPGTLLDVPAAGPDGRPAEGGPRLVAAEGPQLVEAEPNDEPGLGPELPVPGGLSGRIDHDGDVDHATIRARAGRPLIVEVFGHRLGTAIDPLLEILDADGRPIPLAVLRPVARSAVAFRDHNASQDRIRLTRWDELAPNDYLLIGRELTRLFALPRNPDDDAVFWSSGGRRLAYLGTTPEQHPQDRPIDKVEIHPPGTTFPPGGAAPVTLVHRNDDAPGLGKDAALRFDPPRDGIYILRVADARGLGGPGFGYHLVVREPRPDFALAPSTEAPDIPRGGATVVTVNVRRIDGFDGPIEVRAEGLPPGIAATPAHIEPGHFAADLLLTADDDAPTFSPPTWRPVAEAIGPDGAPLRREWVPGGPGSGWITVTPEPDLRVSTDRDRLVIRPGGRAELTVRVARSAAFDGRVPIDIRNLPHGVRVLDVGLNGVLITEALSERTVTLFAEPWAAPGERPVFAVGRIEAVGTDHAAPPITLVVAPDAE